MQYCYFGSKWGDKSKPLLEIFFNHNVVFAGLPVEEVNSYKNKFKAGTKIAITDGLTIKAVGIAEEDFDSLDNLGINFLPEEQRNFSVNNSVLAVKVKLFKLREEDWFQYKAALAGFQPIVSSKDIQDKINELIKKYSGEKMKEEIIKLLKSNKNLILTGAPGTGKTYLAKEIANEMGEYKFVQFHPSYDYTDFVEGLRPQDENGNIGFYRKDGVFKEFCKKALKNLVDSKKDIATLNYEEIIKKYLIDFYNYINDEIDEEKR